MELKQYGMILWRWLWLIILGTALAAGVAYITSRRIAPIYEATATILVSGGQGVRTTDYASLVASEQLAQTYAQLMTKRPVLEEAIRTLNLSITTDALAKLVSVALVPNTQLLKINVENEDPVVAATLANFIPDVFSRQNEAQQASRYASSKTNLSKELDSINALIEQTQLGVIAVGTPSAPGTLAELARLQSEMGQLRQSYASVLQSYESVRLAEVESSNTILIVEPAQVPIKPVRPNVLQNTLLAAVVGLMLACGIAFLVEYLDDSIRSPEQVALGLGSSVIGSIARMKIKSKNGDPLLPQVITEPRAPVAEAFRSLRSSIQFSAMDRPVRSILITSPGPGEGKSTVAANLAVVMAQAGMRVLLMDCDLRRPAIYKIFDRNNKMGLTNVILKDSIYWDVAPQTTDVTNLFVITSGPLPPNPSELLGSERMAHLATFYRDTFDLLIVDGPPLLSVTDASILSRLVDGVVMVVEAGQTHEAAARLACGQLAQAGARLLGFVMNKIPVGRNGYYYYHYYGYYGYDTKPKSSWTDNLRPSRWRERPVGEEVKAVPGNGSGPMLEQPVEVEVKE